MIFAFFSPSSSSSFFSPSRSSFHLRYDHIFIPRLLDDAAHRSFRGSNCAASPRGLTAGTSLHDDSTIVRYVEKQRPSAKKEEDQPKKREKEREGGGERMIGMACTKFGASSRLQRKRNSKNAPRKRDT